MFLYYLLGTTINPTETIKKQNDLSFRSATYPAAFCPCLHNADMKACQPKRQESEEYFYYM